MIFLSKLRHFNPKLNQQVLYNSKKPHLFYDLRYENLFAKYIKIDYYKHKVGYILIKLSRSK